MQNFIPPLLSSERKGTPMGVGAGVYKSAPPATPRFQNHHNTFLQQPRVLFQFQHQLGTEESAGHPDRNSQEARSSKEHRAAAIATRMMMDRQMQLVRQCDMEVMKMAMLKHEETFRQQVHELHRLYRIQRELMSDLTGRDAPALMTSTTRRRNKQPRRALNLQLPADEYIVSTDEDEDAAGTELELTLAVGGRCGSAAAAGRRKNNNRRRQRDNNAGGSGDSSPFGSDCSGASIDLSSSPPPSSAEYYSDDGPAVFHAPPPPPPPCQRAVAAFELGEGMMTMRQHAPWLLQCQQYLSLRMT